MTVTLFLSQPGCCFDISSEAVQSKTMLWPHSLERRAEVNAECKEGAEELDSNCRPLGRSCPSTALVQSASDMLWRA